jgi:hypothetical protein
MSERPDASQYRGPLAPEECAKWDALAYAGEEPVMEWERNGMRRFHFIPAFDAVVHIDHLRNEHTMQVNVYSVQGYTSHYVVGHFRTITGAKLCAEAILRERTRALHRQDTTPQETQANG